MQRQLRTWALWVLPFAAIFILMVGIRAQVLAAVPVAIVLVAVWLYLLPRPEVG